MGVHFLDELVALSHRDDAVKVNGMETKSELIIRLLGSPFLSSHTGGPRNSGCVVLRSDWSMMRSTKRRYTRVALAGLVCSFSVHC